MTSPAIPLRDTPGLVATYANLLALTLAGYAVLGKGFAYLGIPPMFIGEAMYAAGIIAFLRTGQMIAVAASPASIALGALMAWVALRTVPYIESYGAYALRDSIIAMYGGFAFIVAALLLDNPRRLNAAIRFFRLLAGVVVIVAPLLYILFEVVGEDNFPKWPISNHPMIFLKAGDISVHLSGAAVLALVGLRRVGPAWIAAFFFAFLVVATQNRGGMLSIVLPCAFAAIAIGRLRELCMVIAAGVAALSVAYGLGLELQLPYRSISAEQLVQNIASIFGTGGDYVSQANKAWRIEWWKSIIDYTINGEHFWTGKGFGINLAISDGFEGHHSPPLRSPHNAHLTFLARGGVPALILWAATLAAWYYMLLRDLLLAKLRGNTTWASLFTFIVAYQSAVLINSTFDVALEGPMIGIWFWCLFGFGIAASMLFWAPRGTARPWTLDPLPVGPSPR